MQVCPSWSSRAGRVMGIGTHGLQSMSSHPCFSTVHQQLPLTSGIHVKPGGAPCPLLSPAQVCTAALPRLWSYTLDALLLSIRVLGYCQKTLQSNAVIRQFATLLKGKDIHGQKLKTCRTTLKKTSCQLSLNVVLIRFHQM